MFESLKMTHEGNLRVKETKALALIQKYEAFKMEEYETIEAMFSRFQILVAGLKVLDKGYSTAGHVKKIIRSLSKKWRPMVTTLKLAKDLNKFTLEELISSLRIHEIELNEDEPQKTNKSVALKSRRKESKALQVLEESSAESSDDEDEMSLLSKRLNHLWKHKNRKFRSSRKPDFRRESSSKSEHRNESSDHKRSEKKEIVCYECNEPGHYKNECPKLQKDRPKRSGDRRKKVLMATWYDSECSDSGSYSDGEHANVALMADVDHEEETSVSGSDSETEEVFSNLTKEELSESLSEMFENYNTLKLKIQDAEKKS